MKLRKIMVLASVAAMTICVSACTKKDNNTVEETVTHNKEYEADAFETEANGLGTSYGVYTRTDLDEEQVLVLYFKDLNGNEFGVKATNGLEMPFVMNEGTVYKIQHGIAVDTKDEFITFDNTVAITEAEEQAVEPLKSVAESVEESVANRPEQNYEDLLREVNEELPVEEQESQTE